VTPFVMDTRQVNMVTDEFHREKVFHGGRNICHTFGDGRIQGDHSPDNVKFPDNSMTFP